MTFSINKIIKYLKKFVGKYSEIFDGICITYNQRILLKNLKPSKKSKIKLKLKFF